MDLFVKPKPGMLMRDPVNHVPLPPNGKTVPANTFWIRRLHAGDVERANAKKARKADKTEKSPQSE
jgi:hypothetical protein